jgi:hypothetical protein
MLAKRVQGRGAWVAETDQLRDSLNPDYVTVEQRVLQDNINLVDAKSGILMALSGGLIARDLDKFFELATTSSSAPAIASVSLAFYGAATAGFILTAYLTWFVLRPRLVKTNDFVYWGSDVYLKGEQHYLDAIGAATAEDFRHHFLRHLHVLARICRRKFTFFVLAMRTAEISLLTTLTAEVTRYAAHAPAQIRLTFVLAGLSHWLHQIYGLLPTL